MKVFVEQKHRIDVTRVGFRKFIFKIFAPRSTSEMTLKPLSEGTGTSYRNARNNALKIISGN